MRRRARLPSSESLTVRIESLSHEGRGVARIDGKATFVAGALPGETVLMRYTERRGRHDEAVAVEVLEASPDRVEPPCAHAGVCGGCSLQHLSPGEQRRHKQQALAEQLRHSGAGEPEAWLEPLVGPAEGYRHKARLMMRWVDKKGGLLIGFSERGGRKVTELASCAVLAPPFGQLIATLRLRFAELDCARSLAQMELAIGETHAVMVLRNLVPVEAADRERLIAFAEEHAITLYLQSGGPDSLELLTPADPPALYYSLLEGRLRFDFLPLDFTQINPFINRAMVARVLELLAPTTRCRVLDLFCGLGNFSLPLALQAGEVLGVEGAAGLVARARENAERNGVKNVHFEAADLATLKPAPEWLRGGYSRVLLDPPRTGAAELIEAIRLGDCERLVYVSCNPATLARDAGLLKRLHGWRLRQAGIMDMFPHTNHVESLAVFEPPT